jgi:putative endonuclease
VEQLVARRAHNPKVVSSSLAPATKKREKFTLLFFIFNNLNQFSMYVVYVLYSQSFDKIYIGYTSDLIDRFKSHNFMSTKGYTVKFRPWKVLDVEFFENKSDAMKREKQLKTSRGRSFIRGIIQ